MIKVSHVVLTVGTFDLFHAGHLELLEWCSQMKGPAGKVVVGLNTDLFVERFKGKRPIVEYAHRARMLRSCRFVDTVLRNGGDEDMKPLMKIVRPSLLAVGDDWAPGNGKDYHAQIQATPLWLAERGIELVFVPRTTGVSSTELKARAKEAL